MSGLVRRNAVPRVDELLSSFRIVLLGGARQTGKTTLVRDLLELPDEAWFSFDDEAVLSRATADPVGFVDAVPRPAAIDEFQRAGRGFLLAVKQARRPGPDARSAAADRLDQLSGGQGAVRDPGGSSRAVAAVAAVDG
jgi:hypothetical protein